jgi:hypothetical protein
MANKDKRSLYDDLMAPRLNANQVHCKLSVMMSDMEEKDIEALNKAIELIKADRGQGRSKTYSASWLTQNLRKHGHSVSISTIQRHINGECPCERLGE